MTKVIISLSGGMDSTTLLADAIAKGNSVEAVGFYYGSKHNKYENKAALDVAGHCNVPFRLIDLSGLMSSFKSNLLKTGGSIPEGHYESESMKLTVVPGRNSIFASVLLGIASSEDAQEIWMGIHAGDHAIYPDCRPEWLQAITRVIEVASEGAVTVQAPFLLMNKTSIITRGMELGVPYNLTRTCYKDQEKSCGKCGSCQERLEAFANNQLKDPILYE